MLRAVSQLFRPTRSPDPVRGEDDPAVHGSTAVEVALVSAVLLLMLGGIVQFGLAISAATQLADAAQAGAQFAAVKPENLTDTAGITQAVRDVLGARDEHVSIASQTFCECKYEREVSCSNTCGGGAAPIRYVQVTVSKPIEISFGFFSEVSHLTRTVAMATYAD